MARQLMHVWQMTWRSAHQAAQRPVPRGLERETSLPPPVSSKEIDGADGTYERVSSCLHTSL